MTALESALEARVARLELELAELRTDSRRRPAIGMGDAPDLFLLFRVFPDDPAEASPLNPAIGYLGGAGFGTRVDGATFVPFQRLLTRRDVTVSGDRTGVTFTLLDSDGNPIAVRHDNLWLMWGGRPRVGSALLGTTVDADRDFALDVDGYTVTTFEAPGFAADDPLYFLLGERR